MLTKDQARTLVSSSVCTNPGWLEPDDELIIVDDETIEKNWGWVFFYTSKLWQQTSDLRYAIAGNAPVIVERSTGRLITTGTERSIEHYIKAYERTGDPHG